MDESCSVTLDGRGATDLNSDQLELLERIVSRLPLSRLYGYNDLSTFCAWRSDPPTRFIFVIPSNEQTPALQHKSEYRVFIHSPLQIHERSPNEKDQSSVDLWDTVNDREVSSFVIPESKASEWYTLLHAHIDTQARLYERDVETAKRRHLTSSLDAYFRSITD